MAELQESILPTGWECKFDGISGKYYYVNHNNKTTTWEDPRLRFKQGGSKASIPGEYITMQHGSPDVKRNSVYPSQASPKRAFQAAQIYKTINPQDMKPVSRSPLLGRTARVQDSSFTIPIDVDEAVSKLLTMFPTVSETHVRMLMRKYHNREALVISALQVEKNPITTPGPFATPPPQRNIHHPSVYALQTPPLGLYSSSRGGSPILRPGSGTNPGSPAFRSSPRPHSSPKLKLRYMKSIFPEAEETVILDILYTNDNNIQKSSETLKDMGFQRKEAVKPVPPKVQIVEDDKSEDNQKEETVPATPKVKTPEEKDEIKKRLKEKYKEVADHLIGFALESVEFDEKRAGQILDIMVKENTEKENNKQVPELDETRDLPDLAPKLNVLPVSQSRQSIKSLLKSEKFVINSVQSTTTAALGPNPALAKGSNDKLLLVDYVDWQGPAKLHKGPNSSLLTSRTYRACGSNPELRRGPKFGLAKGSNQMIVGESQ